MIAPCEVMSEAYLDLQKELHARPEGYGDKGDKWAPAVADLARRFGARSVLDYGCGAGALARALSPLLGDGVHVAEFDPAVPGKDGWPAVADLVVCCDVLEHVESAYLSSTMTYLFTLSRMGIFAVVSTRPAQRTLADGRNAHLIIESDAWWLETFRAAGFFVSRGPLSPHPKPSRELSVVLT